MSKANLFKLTGYLLFLVFFITVFFSFRAISSFALAGLLIWALASSRIQFKWNATTGFLLAILIYFIIGLLSVLRLAGPGNWEHVLLQAGLLLAGLTAYVSLNAKKLNWDTLFLLLIASLGLALLYCLIVNAIEFSKSGDSTLFFYHSLASPARQHAVFLSIYVFTAIVYLVNSLRQNHLYFHKGWYFLVSCFFFLSLLLLSSKLVIGFCLVYFLLQLSRLVGEKKNLTSSVFLISIFLLAMGLTLFTRNPVGERFREIVSGNTQILPKNKYDPGDYLNGVQFRVLQWKLVKEILNEKRSWLTGVGAGNARLFLDEKYRAQNMYLGEPSGADHGYLGYNSHNQFLEAMLHYGLAGGIAFLAILIFLLKMAWEKRRSGFGILFLLLFIYSLTESVFETQYGIILFCFLPLFLYGREETF